MHILCQHRPKYTTIVGYPSRCILAAALADYSAGLTDLMTQYVILTRRSTNPHILELLNLNGKGY